VRLYLKTGRPDQCGIVEVQYGQHYACGFCGTTVPLIREAWPQQVDGPVAVTANYQAIGSLTVCRLCVRWIVAHNMRTAEVGSAIEGTLFFKPLPGMEHGKVGETVCGWLVTWFDDILLILKGVRGANGALDLDGRCSMLGGWKVTREASPDSFPVKCVKLSKVTLDVVDPRPQKRDTDKT